jgi:hypothetical protein
VSHQALLKSTLRLSTTIDMYFEGQKKLRKTFEEMSIKDHKWVLKSYDRKVKG